MKATLSQLFTSTLEQLSLDKVMPGKLAVSGGVLQIGEERIQLAAFRKVIIVAIGKAAYQMAEQTAEILKPHTVSGMIVTSALAGGRLTNFMTYEGGHPYPNEQSVWSANVAQELLSDLKPDCLVLYLLSGVASRQAHRVVKVVGQEEGAARFLWGVDLFLFIALALAAFGEVNAVLIAAFVLLHALQNLWRPILLSRLDSCTSEAQGATILSIESQARRTATIVVAPLLGLAVDAVQAHQFGGAFWPAGVLGATVALAFFLMEIGRRGKVQMQ